MSRGYDVPALHQQDGVLSVQAFAEREGLTRGQAMRCIRGGKVLGARQDARSKHWSIYPPAKLMERPRDHRKRSAPGANAPGAFADRVPECETSWAAPPSGAGVMAAASCGHADTHPVGVAAKAAIPPHASQQAPKARAVGFDFGFDFSGEGGKPAAYAEARNVLRLFREAVARQHREGIHYLRLNSCEFSRLYAALDHERSRIRKLVGKGLAAVGELRATDSVWQKMQAMCQEGRLL